MKQLGGRRPGKPLPGHGRPEMPIYEYLCQKCGAVMEELVPMGGKPDLACNKCGSRKLERKFSTFGTGRSSSGPSGSACAGYT